MEECIARFVRYQIRKKRIKESDLEVYEYGYRLLVEKVCALFMTIALAFIFDAWMEVLVFCIAFIPIRTYAGGYHAKATVSCMVLSALVLLLNIFCGQWILSTGYGNYMMLFEVLLFPAIVWMTPVENTNRKISESEKHYFKHIVRVMYIVQIVAGLFLLWMGRVEVIISLVLAHASVLGSLVAGIRENRYKKVCG